MGGGDCFPGPVNMGGGGGGGGLLVKKRLVFNRSLISCFLAPSFCPSPISPWSLYILFPLSFSLPSSLISSLSPLPSTYPPPPLLSPVSALPTPYVTLHFSLFHPPPSSPSFPFALPVSPSIPLSLVSPLTPPPPLLSPPSSLPTNISPSISLLSLSLSLSPSLLLLLSSSRL